MDFINHILDKMEDSQIPVLLVAGRHALTPALDDALIAAAVMTPQEVISKRGIVETRAEIIIADIRDTHREAVVECALLLRNAGRTVIICDAGKAPVELVKDLHHFTTKNKSEGRSVRTEALLTEEAMQSFGDITDVVAAFEKKYLVD